VTRVLLVNSHGADESRGGAERYVAELARGLPGRGFEVSLLSAFPGEAAVPVPAVVLHSTDWGEDPVRRARNHLGSLTSRPTRRLAEALAAAAPEVVHTHNLPGITTAIWEVARRAGVPVVHCLHDYHLLCPRVTLMRPDGSPCRPHPLLCGLRTRRLARWAGGVRHVHGPSGHVLRRHAGLFAHAETSVVRHPRGQAPGRPLAPPAGTLRTLGFIGALDRTKGVDVLLEALPGLECELRIAGDGTLRPEVESAANRLSNLSYLGPVTGKAKDDFLESCDAGIVPSVWAEPAGPPFAVLEWLGAGRPVLASRNGGLAESLDELAGAIAVTPTAGGLAEALAELGDPETWRAALGRVRAVHDPADRERWLDDHVRILRSVS
jgi:glycosyltransferase involved in cell wall biosynthesis